MDLPRAFIKCRPEATFRNNSVNYFSLETANDCYEEEDKVTQTELDTAWSNIQDEDIKRRKKEETESLAGEKADAFLSKTSDRRKMKQVSRAVKLVFKKVKGTISPNEEAELDALETLDDKIDAIYDAADTIFDKIDNDSSYNHIDSNHWPQS